MNVKAVGEDDPDVTIDYAAAPPSPPLTPRAAHKAVLAGARLSRERAAAHHPPISLDGAPRSSHYSRTDAAAVASSSLHSPLRRERDLPRQYRNGGDGVDMLRLGQLPPAAPSRREQYADDSRGDGGSRYDGTGRVPRHRRDEYYSGGDDDAETSPPHSGSGSRSSSGSWGPGSRGDPDRASREPSSYALPPRRYTSHHAESRSPKGPSTQSILMLFMLMAASGIGFALLRRRFAVGSWSFGTLTGREDGDGDGYYSDFFSGWGGSVPNNMMNRGKRGGWGNEGWDGGGAAGDAFAVISGNGNEEGEEGDSNGGGVGPRPPPRGAAASMQQQQQQKQREARQQQQQSASGARKAQQQPGTETAEGRTAAAVPAGGDIAEGETGWSCPAKRQLLSPLQPRGSVPVGSDAASTSAGTTGGGAASSPSSSSCFPPHTRGYIHLVSTREGMSAWSHILYEVLATAKALNRTLVEPCVAGGELVPCVPGLVAPVPASLKAMTKGGAKQHSASKPGGVGGAITAFSDPLRVPAFLSHCGSAGRGSRLGVEPRHHRAYPLSLYIDLRSLRAEWPHIIPFTEWAARELCECNDELVWDGKRVIAEVGYCVAWGPRAAQIRSHWCAPDHGRYMFENVWAPRTIPAHMPAWVRSARFAGHMHYYRDEFAADTRRNMFFFNVWKGSFAPLGTFAKKNPRFNDIHAAAVDAWVSERLGPDALGYYAAFQWRTETVPEELLLPCAERMAKAAAPIVDALRSSFIGTAAAATAAGGGGGGGGPRAAGGVLVSDIPSDGNPCKMWREYYGVNRGMDASSTGSGMSLVAPVSTDVSPPRRALRKLLSIGLVKYDADHPGIDSGVLSIRDWLLAGRARYYITCSGDAQKCKGCFRKDSKFVQRVIQARRVAKLSSFTRWFELSPKALFGMAAGPPPGWGVDGPLEGDAAVAAAAAWAEAHGGSAPVGAGGVSGSSGWQGEGEDPSGGGAALASSPDGWEEIEPRSGSNAAAAQQLQQPLNYRRPRDEEGGAAESEEPRLPPAPGEQQQEQEPQVDLSVSNWGAGAGPKLKLRYDPPPNSQEQPPPPLQHEQQQAQSQQQAQLPPAGDEELSPAPGQVFPIVSRVEPRRPSRLELIFREQQAALQQQAEEKLAAELVLGKQLAELELRLQLQRSSAAGAGAALPPAASPTPAVDSAGQFPMLT